MGSGDIPESEVRKGLRKDFLFGFATAAAQIEAGGEEKEIASGKGPSVSVSPGAPRVLFTRTPQRVDQVADMGRFLRQARLRRGWLVDLEDL